LVVGSAAAVVAAVSSPSGSGWGRSGHRRVVLAGALVLLVVLGGGAAAWATVGSESSGYRTATATRADIGQTMDVVGTVEPVNDASASFQLAGQVASVGVTPGAEVSAGQSLATLDTTSLSESVSSAQLTLDSDEAKLAQDETSATESSSSSSSSVSPSSSKSGPTSTTTTTTPSTHGGSGGGAQSTITEDENTLTQDQAKEAAAQQQEAADQAQEDTACGISGTTSTTTTSPANCEAAITQVSKDQQQVSVDQAAVAKDETTLAQALGQASSGTSGGSGGSGGGAHTSQALSAASDFTGNSGSGTSSQPGSGGGSGSAGSGATASAASSDTPQQIAADQAAIDSSQANLTEAEQSLAEANLTSPINGTVVSVGITTGDTVSANSSTEVIVIIGTQSYEIAGTLSSTQVPSVKVGDSAQVQVDGLEGTINGTVSQLGPVQSSESGDTYPLVVALPSSATGLFTGSTANVVVATGSVANVVAVPTSAVQTVGTRSYVTMLSNGTLTRKVIKAGMVGEIYTQVLSGLTPGQSVVLADYAEPVPSSNTDTFGGGLGGFSGAGGFGGFGGGAFRIQRTTAGGGGGGGGATSFVGG
jgi:trimeric autotransporter adhesin